MKKMGYGRRSSGWMDKVLNFFSLLKKNIYTFGANDFRANYYAAVIE
jgi:ABC-type Fe2+-enterobactin transport system substrate-binding protein